MLVRTWPNRNSHSLLARMQNGAATLEDVCAVSYQTEHTLTIWSSHLPPWNETSVYPKTCPWMFATPLFVIAKNWKQPKCLSIGTLVYSHNGVLVSAKRKWPIKPWKEMGETLNVYCLIKDAGLKGIHSVGSQLWYSWKDKIREKAKRSLVAEEEGKMNRWGTGYFLGSETLTIL